MSSSLFEHVHNVNSTIQEPPNKQPSNCYLCAMILLKWRLTCTWKVLMLVVWVVIWEYSHSHLTDLQILRAQILMLALRIHCKVQKIRTIQKVYHKYCIPIISCYHIFTQCIDLFLAFILTGLILDDEVRAPIPQKQETLIEAGYEGYQMNNRQNYRKARIRTVFDGFRNFGNEASSKYSSICDKTTGSYQQARYSDSFQYFYETQVPRQSRNL